MGHWDAEAGGSGEKKYKRLYIGVIWRCLHEICNVN